MPAGRVVVEPGVCPEARCGGGDPDHEVPPLALRRMPGLPYQRPLEAAQTAEA